MKSIIALMLMVVVLPLFATNGHWLYQEDGNDWEITFLNAEDMWNEFRSMTRDSVLVWSDEQMPVRFDHGCKMIVPRIQSWDVLVVEIYDTNYVSIFIFQRN